MRIGLYGLPCAGKTTLLNQVRFARVLTGSALLRELDPAFDRCGEEEQRALRRRLACTLREDDHFLMDGHYAFGERSIVFTEEDGALYDAFLYLYIAPEILKSRMEQSEKNRKYASFDLDRWQRLEIQELRTYCHSYNKDFYILDNPPQNQFTGAEELEPPLSFIRAITEEGYSCVGFARACAEAILSREDGPGITLTDGDRTLTMEDSSAAVFQYATRLFDGNFYTGYQVWRQGQDFGALELPAHAALPVHMSRTVLNRLASPAYILTSGHPGVWERLSAQLGLPCFSGNQMSADAKFFITKFLQEAGRQVTAYGDSLNDFFMLRQADQGYLIAKPDGSLSRSLRGQDLGGIQLV